jgi:hypothetical protein
VKSQKLGHLGLGRRQTSQQLGDAIRDFKSHATVADQ